MKCSACSSESTGVPSKEDREVETKSSGDIRKQGFKEAFVSDTPGRSNGEECEGLLLLQDVKVVLSFLLNFGGVKRRLVRVATAYVWTR